MATGTGHDMLSNPIKRHSHLKRIFSRPAHSSRKSCECYGKFTSVGGTRTKGLLCRTRLRADGARLKPTISYFPLQ
jgi:hypothetical protein